MTLAYVIQGEMWSA